MSNEHRITCCYLNLGVASMDDLDVPSSPAHLSLFRSYEDVSNSTDPGIRVEPTPEKTLLVPLVSNNSPSSPLVTPRLDHISYGTELGDPGATDDTLDGSFHGATRDIQEDVQEGAVSLPVILISVITRRRNLILTSR